MLIYKIINIIIFFSTIYVGLWLYFDLFRKLRVDLTRKKLFEVRNELFYLGVDGTLSFDSKAYGLCRKTLNGYIRFCHRLTYYRFCAHRAFQTNENRMLSKNYNEVKECARQDLNNEQIKALDEIYYRMHEIVATHILKTCLPFLLILNCFHAVFKLFRILELVKNAALIRTTPFFSSIDAKAKQYGAAHLDPAQIDVCQP